jgi:hypothetical protein
VRAIHLAALVLLVPAVLAAVPRTEYRPYNVGVGLTAGCPGALLSVGGACFALDGSEASVSIAVRDSTFQVGVPAAWALRDAADAQLSNGWFCDSTGPITVPSGAARLYVWVGGVQNEVAAGCTPGLATTGLVEANFA